MSATDAERRLLTALGHWALDHDWKQTPRYEEAIRDALAALEVPGGEQGNRGAVPREGLPALAGVPVSAPAPLRACPFCGGVPWDRDAWVHTSATELAALLRQLAGGA